MATLERGIRETAWGYQVYTRKGGRFRSAHFTKDTSLPKLRAALELLEDTRRLDGPAKLPTGTGFAADCARYLRAVKSMPTFSDREYRIQQWLAAFGPHCQRSAITAADIRQQLETWKTDLKLSHGTLNLRRTALMHLYTVLDGKSAPNIVKDVPRYRETPAPLKLPTLEDAEKAIAAVRVTKGREKTRARLRVLLWTGLPAAQVKRLTLADLDMPNARVFVQARQKGAGARARWLPLVPQAVAALREFARVKAFGAFSTSSMHSSLKMACDKSGVPRFNPYALRHLFLTLVAQLTRDDRVVAELAMHSDLRQTRRYTEQSVDPRLAAAIAKVAEALK
jgi:integrase